MSHTILLMQPGSKAETRTYCYVDTVNDCIEHVCKIYEEHLKQRKPHESHTILLMQPGSKAETRTYCYVDTVNDCIEHVCKIYEEHLKQRKPHEVQITYDISQLFDFIDNLNDMSCLVYQKSTSTYAPYTKDWVKEKIYIMLKRQAESSRDSRQ